ncbi:MAG: M20 family metallo-hydrolase [Chloroflexota bacterium]|jgi:hydantoinase/carbamoylase family amidase
MEPELQLAIADQVRIDRVMERIHLLADKAGDPGGGVTRLAFSHQEVEAMQLVAKWMEEAGLTVVYDALGNMYGSTDGNATGAEVVAAGSHLDSVPNGGAYDGVLGVIGAIESVASMRAAGFQPKVPLEIVAWRCEEAALFGQGRLGSLYYTGQLSIDTIRSWEKPGLPLGRYLEEVAHLPQRKEGRRFRSYLELHIEQGSHLDTNAIPIGIVTAIPGYARWRITVKGRADHSGATPMDMRKDALCAAAELILAVENAGMKERSRKTVATSTDIRVLPGTWNVIPGTAEMLADIRGIDQESLDRTLADIRQVTMEIAQRRQVEIAIEEASRCTPVQLDETIIAQIEKVTQALGIPATRMPSAAGHDAQTIAIYTPTGMVFVPSIDGISHAPEENSRPEDIEAGIKVLATTLAALATGD